MNFSISDYEITKANVQALMIHEAFGHGVMGYSDKLTNHHKAYFATIKSRYWKDTTLEFKQATVTKMWRYYYKEIGYKRMPEPFQSAYNKYNKRF